jgi:hypothetical protein
MANWLHSGWRQESGAAAQLVKLDLHLTEVADAITASVTKGPSSRDPTVLTTYMGGLEQQRERLTQLVARENSGGIRPVRFG